MADKPRPWSIQALRGVAFAAVLLGVALLFVLWPSPGEYMNRNRVTEAVVAMAACRVSVAEFAVAKRAWPANAREAGCETTTTKYFTGLAVERGRIEVTLKAIHHPDLDGRVVAMQPMADVAATVGADPAKPILGWRCSTNAAPNAHKHFPPNCRNAH